MSVEIAIKVSLLRLQPFQAFQRSFHIAVRDSQAHIAGITREQNPALGVNKATAA